MKLALDRFHLQHMILALGVGSSAMVVCELGQALTGAAISNFDCVPEGRLAPFFYRT